MTDLIDRLSGESEAHDPPRPKLPAHQWNAGFILNQSGKWTKQEVLKDADLQGDELTQAAAIDAVFDSKGSKVAMVEYNEVVKAVSYRLESIGDTIYHNPDGTVNKARVELDLEIVGWNTMSIKAFKQSLITR